MGNRIAVYTAIFGNYDTLKIPLSSELKKEPIDFICFTDNDQLTSDYFEIRIVKKKFKDPVRNARYYKINSHLVLPAYNVCCWIDANMIIITNSFNNLIDKYLANADLAIFQHSDRNCLYSEADWASDDQVDNTSIIRSQMKRYSDEGFPENFGLVASNVILRRNSSTRLKQFNEAWWKELSTGSRRDQLSFDFVRWKLKFPVEYFSEGRWDNSTIAIRSEHALERKPFQAENPEMISMQKIKKLFLLFTPPVIFKLYHKWNPQLKKQQSTAISEIDFLESLPRYTAGETQLLGEIISFPDARSFVFIYKELFQNDTYKFLASNERPYIIDAGANIGLSVIYFKKLYPQAKIIAFEPDSKIFSFLERNMASFKFEGVKLEKKACWKEDTILKFYSEGADSGRLTEANEAASVVEVEAVRLSKYIENQKVDFLKIDIEGAEVEVIYEIMPVLKNVANIFIEYHSFVGKEQKLPELLSILKDAGFTIHLSSPVLVSKSPFIELTTYLNMDNLLNIYGFRNNGK